MQQVNDLNHFSALIKEAKISSEKLITNCFLLPAQIHPLTQQKKIFAEHMNNGICFLCDVGDFYNLYFYLPDGIEIRYKQKDKPVVINFVYRNSSQTDALRGVKEKWIVGGFSRYKSYRRMSLDAGSGETISRENQLIQNCAYTVTFAQNQHLDELLTLWRNTLDIYSNAMPSKEEMERLLDTQQVLCIQDHNRHVIAALQMQAENKICSIQHVAVDEKHRRRGLAKILLNYGFAESRNINRYILWVEDKNIPAIHLYLEFGFKYDGMSSNQLLLV